MTIAQLILLAVSIFAVAVLIKVIFEQYFNGQRQNNITPSQSKADQRNLTKPIFPKSDRSRFGIVIGLTLVIMVGAVLCTVGIKYYRTIEGARLFLFSLVFSVPAVIGFAGWAAWFLRENVQFKQEAILILILSLLSFPIIGYAGCLFYNAILDDGYAVVHQVFVRDKRMTRVKGSKIYRINVRSWREGKDVETIRIDHVLYGQIQVDKTYVKIQIKPGKLNFEWISNISIIEMDNPLGKIS